MEKRYIILQCKNSHCKSFSILSERTPEDRQFDCEICSTRMELKGYLKHGTLSAIVKDVETWLALEKGKPNG